MTLAKGVKKMNTNEIKFGIRKKVLEDKGNRTFLKEYLSTHKDMTLTVIIGVEGRTVEIHSCLPSTYKPLDFTKLPKPEDSPEWQKAITTLIKSEKGSDVIWFDSEDRAIFYIKSNYPEDSEK